MMIRQLYALIAIAIFGAPTAAMAGEVRVHASGAIAVSLKHLRADYEARSGDILTIKVDRSADIERAVAVGEKYDVVIAEATVVDRLIAAQHAVLGSVMPLATSPICVVVPAGRPLPSIDTMAALRRALLGARSVGYSNSLSGTYVTKTMFPKMGIERQMEGVSHQVPIASATAAGTVDIAFSQCSEMLHVPGLTVVGPLPRDVQHLSVLKAFTNVRAVEPAAGARLIRYLSSSSAHEALRNAGLAPYGTNPQLGE